MLYPSPQPPLPFPCPCGKSIRFYEIRRRRRRRSNTPMRLISPSLLTPVSQEFPDEDWWLGDYGGKKGLFPANYVKVDE
jgi:hypothetical protein